MLGQSGMSLSNQRQHQRLGLSVPVLYYVNGVQHQGELLDISAGGMRLRVATLPALGSMITVSPNAGNCMPGRQRIPCHLAWRRFVRPEPQIGLRFQASPDTIKEYWVQTMLCHLEPHKGRRRFRRFACELGVHLLDGSRSLATGVCLDVGLGGCLIQLQHPLGVGKRICLGLGAGRFESNLALDSVVVYAAVKEIGQLPLYRVRFLRMEKSQSRRLQSLIGCCLDQDHPFGDEPKLDARVQEEICRQPPLPRVVNKRVPMKFAPLERPLVPVVREEPLWRLPHPQLLRKRAQVLRCPSLWAARAITPITHPGGSRHYGP